MIDAFPDYILLSSIQTYGDTNLARTCHAYVMNAL